MANILITGGAGFIGSNLSKRLISEGHNVFIVDNLSTGYRENVPKDATFIEGNAADRALLDKLGDAELDVIFHFSGQSSGEISFDDPLRDLSDNVSSTLVICDFMIKHKINKIIFASSVVLYGNTNTFPSKEGDMDCEKIKSFYGVSKLASENYLRLYHENYGINPICLRLFTIYGPGQNMANLRQGMASIFLELIMRGENPVKVHGSLERFRDLMHIDDLVEICVRLMNKDLSGYHIYNVGTGKKTKVKDIIKYQLEALDKKLDVVEEGNTFGDFFGAQADINRLIEAIEYKPRISAEEGIKTFAKWYESKLKRKVINNES